MAVLYLVVAMEAAIGAHLLAAGPVSPAQDKGEVLSRDCSVVVICFQVLEALVVNADPHHSVTWAALVDVYFSCYVVFTQGTFGGTT